jgi:AhpC/TSA family
VCTLKVYTVTVFKEVVVRHPKLTALVAAIGLASVVLVFGQGGVELKAGDVAPDFALPGSDGKTWKLSELRGKTVVLAWFPKAFTGG